MVAAAFLFNACDQIGLSTDELTVPDIFTQMFDKGPEKAKVMDVNFSPDYKTFTITTKINEDIGPYELSDSTKVKIGVEETIDGIREARFSSPQLVKIENVEAEFIHKNDIRMLLLVDLSLPQADLNRIREQVKEIKTAFSYENLFVAFMEGPGVSNTMVATDYVIDNHFNHSTYNYSYLYQSILQKRNEMLERDGFWQDADKLVMLVFSNGKVYKDNSDRPIDPKHYQNQGLIATQNAASSDSTFLAFYASYYHHDDLDDSYDDNLLHLFCNNNGGAFFNDFQWSTFKDNLFNTLHMVSPDHIFYFENPDYKVYRGDNKKLTLNFYDRSNDSLFLSVSATIVKGECLNPIIVHGQSITNVILQGLFLGCFLLLLVYLVLQVIVPYIRYRVFLRRHVVTYTGRNMSFDNKVIEESCYLCKAPFEEGDRIVVKCEHTMHKSCWDENDYHCPEYSDRCKRGSHYYNKTHLLDPRNASFYLKWVVTALAGSIFAWLFFIYYAHQCYNTPLYHFGHTAVTQIPIFGFAIGFFLTLGFSAIMLRPGKNSRLILQILGRAVVAAVGSYLAFMLVDLIIYLFDIHRFTFLLNWIPWTTSGFIIIYCSTFNTRIAHNKLLLLLVVLLGFLSMYAWALLFRYMELDFRVMLLFSFIIFGVGLAACIASVAPHSERYFLKVQGAIKTMDIALYKWFRNQPDRVVTVGKSVDCSLQLSWDIQSNVAPVQAEIRMKNQVPYLIALEPGVYLGGKPAHVDKKIRLYHGRVFTIGQTTFTYIEKDR